MKRFLDSVHVFRSTLESEVVTSKEKFLELDEYFDEIKIQGKSSINSSIHQKIIIPEPKQKKNFSTDMNSPRIPNLYSIIDKRIELKKKAENSKLITHPPSKLISEPSAKRRHSEKPITQFSENFKIPTFSIDPNFPLFQELNFQSLSNQGVQAAQKFKINVFPLKK